MKNGDYVIRFKGTDMYFVSGSYARPLFAGFLDAWPYGSADAAREAAGHMCIGRPDTGATLEVVRLANLPDIFDPEHGAVATLDAAMEHLGALEKLDVSGALAPLRALQRASHDARLALAQQCVALGADLAGNDVVAEVVPRHGVVQSAGTA